MSQRQWPLLQMIAIIGVCVLPTLGYCDVEGSLNAIQSKFTGVFLPALSIMGLVWAGLSLISGNPAAKQHIFWAVVGAGIGFGATSIVEYVKTLAR